MGTVAPPHGDRTPWGDHSEEGPPRGGRWWALRARWQKVTVVALAVAVVLPSGGPDAAEIADPAQATVEAEPVAEPPREAIEERTAAPTDEQDAVPPSRRETTSGQNAEARPALGADPAPTPSPPGGRPPSTWEVVRIVDGDTIDVRAPAGETERVRIIGIDTPERGECGHSEASEALASLLGGRSVALPGGARDDRDRYSRILRYVEVGDVDAGRELLARGLASARYDSRDGYGGHPREADYIAVDAASPAFTCAAAGPARAPAPAPTQAPVRAAAGGGTGLGGSWRNCAEARAAGAAPVPRADAGYGPHLDGDDDGIGCE